MLKKLAALGLVPAAILLSAYSCTVAGVNASIESAATQDLPSIGALVATDHAIFLTVAATLQAAGKPLPAALITDEGANYDVVTQLVANPPSDINSAITAAAKAYATIVADLAKAKQAQSS